jgi:hypothetical protein
MIRRSVSRLALVFAAAAAVHLGLGLPARRDRDEARRQYAREREERERLRLRVAELERRTAGLGRSTAGDAAGAARALRAALLRATDGVAVGGVQIAAGSGGSGAIAAHGRLAATGRLADVLIVAGRLVRPSSGVLLERVRLAEAGANSGKVRLEVEAFGMGAGS